MVEEPFSSGIQKNGDLYLWLQCLEDPNPLKMLRNKRLKSQTYMTWKGKGIFYWGNDKSEAHFTVLEESLSLENGIPTISLSLKAFYLGIGTREIRKMSYKATRTAENKYDLKSLFKVHII